MRLIISFLLFFVVNVSFSQQTKELTEQEYLLLQDKIRLNLNANRDSAAVYANEMAKSGNYKHLAFANVAQAYLLQLKDNTAKSKEKYDQAFKYLEKMPDSKDKDQLKAYLYNYGGLIEGARGNYSKALENYQTGMKISTNIGDIIQIVKFKSNIAFINEAIGNYQLAIKNLKQLNTFIDNNESYFTKQQFNTVKSSNNLTLAASYEGWYMKNQSPMYLLDSAAYFYKKTVSYSQNLPINNIKAKISLGNVYYMKNDYKNAEKTYYNIVFYAKQNNLKREYKIANYNLGNLYYETKKYDKALVFFKKVDSISEIDNLRDESFLKSNYYQAKIYNIYKEPQEAFKHSKIYLDNYEKSEAKLNNEALEVNYKLGTDDLSDEMVTIQKKYENDVLLNKALKVFYVLLVVGIVFLLIKNIIDKNKAHKKMNALIEEFKANLEKKSIAEASEIEEMEQVPDLEEISLKKENVALSIDEAKENKIVEKLLALESKLEYLNADFTLPYVAKKIKTNTTYLSYVVNKRFGKSFGEYSNELKINYVINEMITNHMYRKYSTQAIAESVGFKNAVSFAKSFRKRTGVSPAQFANNI
ncbi:helix-turn-helix domain-containing protein [Flavobacterium johnsoniae]|uniref:Response regulator receiver protein n=1 Tax=Flavobacterium johnsoniae (strain ATCC 17061 / DSM 2064 / JCM 8514 / BCRC 14874 / CCUG 350202 / NBRC 14942 / NCIMB 11054 / UW101) TaxID=376686 RepID=A5FKE6_FLAJ1|nr:helix-turn-helix domain-containing protein [Flavobacterium johnsoniae]ABQ04323.1 response regulator receiver protein [Flavobacterium johnsoniae UW101]OXG02451.1 histidine kinase [Flavobacterium johnsoniae UW101]WQG83884.1 helix-turn-helix domain-containing protein [Flavobacterium johnsoniae UW101]SHK18974.1 Helix-turn-helix domain-containing protein [Flavobacterium johnsoniae]